MKKTIKEKTSEFKKIFEGHEKLQSFNPDIFKTVVGKVISDGYDNDGKSELYMLTFILKTDFQSKIDALIHRAEKRVNPKKRYVLIK